MIRWPLAARRWIDRVAGTIDDYDIRDGQEVSLSDYDSADAYAGTFLILVSAWAKAGTPSDQLGAISYLRGHAADLLDIAKAIMSMQDYDGLIRIAPALPPGRGDPADHDPRSASPG